MHILHVVGARPNFVKAAAVMRALDCRSGQGQILIHTGQHYDTNMSEIFFRQLGMPWPDVNLDVGSGSHAQQTGEVMLRIEPEFLKHRPDLVLVYGDVNSTLAAALVCSKLQIPVGHVEAGLRSFDTTMPEEINRLLTDQISDLLFTPSSDANENLKREGVPAEKIYLVGNVMIDTLVRLLSSDEILAAEQVLRDKLTPSGSAGTKVPDRYGLVTLHRPSNVDDPDMLKSLLDTLADISQKLPLVFPVHPRTLARMQGFPILQKCHQLFIAEPLGYLEFLALQAKAQLVITDSGGIQEETTYLGVPCLTVRENTERPVTITLGTNVLVGHEMNRLLEEVDQILLGNSKSAQVPPLWDGHAAGRIADAIDSWWNGPKA